MQNPDELNRTFGRDGVRFEPGQGGLVKGTLTAKKSEAEFYLYGAHVTRFQKRGERPLLFLSEKSLFAQGKAIRGGIPIIFPWFGAHAEDPGKPAHGFARAMEWTVAGTEASGGKARITMRLESSDATLALWPHEFVARLHVTIDERLTVSLEVTNTSSGRIRFEEALHTYFTIGDIQKVTVRGLEETTYVDKTDGMKKKLQGSAPLTIEKETDSVYINTESACSLHDPELGRTIVVEKSGSRSTVIWNPHAAKAKAMSDFGDEEWQRMLCIETCNAGENAVALEGGETSIMTAVIRSEAS